MNVVSVVTIATYCTRGDFPGLPWDDHRVIAARRSALAMRIAKDPEEVWENAGWDWIPEDLPHVWRFLNSIRRELRSASDGKLRNEVTERMNQIWRWVRCYASWQVNEGYAHCSDPEAKARLEEPWLWKFMEQQGWSPMGSMEASARGGPAPFTVGFAVSDWRKAIDNIYASHGM